MTSLSRLEKLGTIFTRVRDLMRAQVMKEADKPLWYDVMATFPPKQDPTFKQPISPEPLPELMYPEDKPRAIFYRTYANQQTIDLIQHEAAKKSICHRYIEKYQELDSSSGSEMSDEELIVATEQALAAEGISLRRRGVPRKHLDKEAHDRDTKPQVGGLAQLLQEALAKEETQKT